MGTGRKYILLAMVAGVAFLVLRARNGDSETEAIAAALGEVGGDLPSFDPGPDLSEIALALGGAGAIGGEEAAVVDSAPDPVNPVVPVFDPTEVGQHGL